MEEEEEKEEEEDMDVVTDLISRWNIISPHPRNSSSTDWPPVWVCPAPGGNLFISTAPFGSVTRSSNRFGSLLIFCQRSTLRVRWLKNNRINRKTSLPGKKTKFTDTRVDSWCVRGFYYHCQLCSDTQKDQYPGCNRMKTPFSAVPVFSSLSTADFSG